MRFFKRSHLTATALVFVLSGTHSVFASEALLNDFLKGLEGQGYITQTTGVVEQGASVTAASIVISGSSEQPWTMTFNNAVFDNMKQTEGVGLAATSFKSGSVVIANQAANVTFSNFALADFNMPRIDGFLGNLPKPSNDPANPVDVAGTLSGDFYKFFANSTFSSFTFSDWETNFSDPDAESLKFGGKGFFAGPLSEGVLAQYAIEKINISVGEPDPQRQGSLIMTMGPFNVEKYNFANIVEVLDTEKYANGKGDGVWREVVGPASLSNFEALVDGGTIKIASFSAQGSKMRQGDVPPDLVAFQQLASNPQNQSNPAEMKKLIPLIANIYSMFESGALSVKGISIQPPDKKPVEVGEFFIGSFSLENGLSQVRVSDVSAEDVDGVAFKLGSYSIANIQFPELETVMSSVDQWIELGPRRDPTYTIISGLVPTVGGTSITDLEFAPEGDNVLRLKGVSIQGADYVGAIPTKLRIKLDNAEIPVELLNEANPDLFRASQALGYQTIKANGLIEAGWNEATSELVIRPSKVSVTDLGELTLAGTIVGVPRQLIENPEGSLAFLAGLSFKEATVSFSDQSIMNRVIKAFGTDRGLDEAAVKQQYAGLVAGPLAILQNPEFQQKVSTVVTNFLNNPGTVEITAKPPQPVPVVGIGLMAQQSPGELIKTLGIDIQNK